MLLGFFFVYTQYSQHTKAKHPWASHMSACKQALIRQYDELLAMVVCVRVQCESTKSEWECNRELIFVCLFSLAISQLKHKQTMFSVCECVEKNSIFIAKVYHIITCMYWNSMLTFTLTAQFSLRSEYCGPNLFFFFIFERHCKSFAQTVQSELTNTMSYLLLLSFVQFNVLMI